MIKKTLSWPFLFVIMLSQADADQDCRMQIQKVEHTPETYTLVITHEKRCEVLMDHNETHIDLTSKIHSPMHEHKTKGPSIPSFSKIDKLIMLAKSKLGNSYAPAKAGPDHFDCSGFVYFLYKSNGINIPRTSLAQSKSGKKLARKQLQKGDILFFDTHHRNHVNHSGIYLGKGKFIHSSSGKAYGVTISELDKGFYLDKFRWGVRKIGQ